MCKDHPLISVITVVRNSVDGIANTISSVASQTYKNIEYIVIDGQSDDGTLEVVNEHSDSIDVIVSECDEGIYDAMNKAVKIATGDFLNFMNAGDMFDSPETLCDVATALNEDTSVAYGSVQFSNQPEPFTPLPREDWHTGMPFSHQSMFTRRSLLLDMPFDTCYRIAADYDFILKSAARGVPFQELDMVVAKYLEGGLSQKEPTLVCLESMMAVHRNGYSVEKLSESIWVPWFLSLTNTLARTRWIHFLEARYPQIKKLNLSRLRD